MNQKDPVTIRQVGNGFVLTPAPHPGEVPGLMNDREVMVFETLSALLSYVTHHFQPPVQGPTSGQLGTRPRTVLLGT